MLRIVIYITASKVAAIKTAATYITVFTWELQVVTRVANFFNINFLFLSDLKNISFINTTIIVCKGERKRVYFTHFYLQL